MTDTSEVLSRADFDRLRKLVYQESGITLTPEKRTMVETRLRRRLRSLALTSYGEYCHHIFRSGEGTAEIVHLIDAITTNKTDFFREAVHFEYLTGRALPDLDARNGLSRRSLVWSAGCSTGEEPYTLAMVLGEYAQTHAGFHYQVLATDISTEVLAKAALGIFRESVVRPVPQLLRRKYFMRSRDPDSDLLRVVPELRSRIEFRRLNFMDDEYGLTEQPEIIFCRNVTIYFDRPTQARMLKKLTAQLQPGGYFFAGHSESLLGMDLPLDTVEPAVYRKRP